MGVPVEEITAEEWRRMAEEICQRELGVSIARMDEMITSGDLDPDGPHHCAIMRVEMMLPPSRREATQPAQ